MSTIPSETTFDQLFDSIKAALEAIDTVYEVIAGTYSPVDLSLFPASTFPRVSILSGMLTGEEYASQTIITSNYNLDLTGHTYNTDEDRVSGTDMKEVESLGIAMKIAMFGFLNSSPCDGFLIVNPDFSVRPLYQEYDKHINTVVLSISFKVDTDATTA